MAGCSDICTGRWCVFKILYVHLVVVTKYRHGIYAARHLMGRTEETMRDVRADLGCELAGFHGEPEHVHLLVSFPHGGHLRLASAPGPGARAPDALVPPGRAMIAVRR